MKPVIRRTVLAAFVIAAGAAVFAGALVLAQTSLCGVVQERYRYEKRLDYYVEIYETRQQDCDSTAIMTSSRQETQIRDRTAKVAAMNAERQAHIAAANQLQGRINDLNALP